MKGEFTMESFGRKRSFGGGGRGYGGGGGGGSRFGGGGGGRFGGGGRRRSSDSFSQEKPVKEGETYDVEIIEVGSRGDGIAKIQNFVIFIAGAEKGQKVKVRITQVRSSSAIGEIVTEGEASEAKDEPTEEKVEEESHEHAGEEEGEGGETLESEVEKQVEEEGETAGGP